MQLQSQQEIELQIIEGSVQLLREMHSEGSLTYSLLHSYLSGIEDEIKARIWRCLSSEEQAHLRAIEPVSLRERLAKRLIDAIRTRKAENINTEFSNVSQLIDGLDIHEEEILIECLPSRYRRMLAA